MLACVSRYPWFSPTGVIAVLFVPLSVVFLLTCHPLLFPRFCITYHLPARRPPSVLRPLAKSRKLPGSGTETGASGPAFGATGYPALGPAPPPPWCFPPRAWEYPGSSAIIATTIAIVRNFIRLTPRQIASSSVCLACVSLGA